MSVLSDSSLPRAYRSVLSTPLGDMAVCASENALLLLEFADRNGFKEQMAKLEKAYRLEEGIENHPILDLISSELDAYFTGKLQNFKTPVLMRGTDFQIQCWEALRAIPYGKTSSYKDQAHSIGREKAVRAVAHANSLNPLAIIVPCHRVIGSNGTLTGYAGGIDRKAKLLDIEKAS